MSLRRQLGLFFGGLIGVILTMVVWTNYKSLYESLEKSLAAQFSVAPYLQLAEVERSLLYERARAVVNRIPVITGVRKLNKLVEKNGLHYFQKMRLEKGNPNLSSLYEQILIVLTRGDTIEGEDLIALIGNEGTVLVETLNTPLAAIESNGKDFEFKVVKDNLTGEPFWPVVSNFQSARGYLVYPNRKIYFYGSDTLLSHFGVDGTAIVGMEIDRPFLKQISKAQSNSVSETDETHSIVVFDGGVVASSDTADQLGEELANRASQDVPIGTWVSNSGERFLLKSASLKSFYFTDEELAQFEGMEDFEELLKELNEKKEVGRFYLLRNVREIEAQAFAGARETLLLGASALLAALLAVSILANRFTEPVGALTERMKGVGRGELEQLAGSELSSITELKEAGQSFNQMVIGLRQKKILEHFVPEGTRREVEALQGKTTGLGGKRWERTIMFSDLRGFTSMSESMSPDEVMAVLNKYLHYMSKAIRLNEGDINEYIGDAILAVFESPDAAVKAAIAMTKELEVLHTDESIPALASLAQGIGLHTGQLVEGNIGEENRRLKRAVVGDTVNLAARIQDRSRDGSHTCIFLSQSTKDKLTLDVEVVHFGDEMFKGKADPIPVWEVKLG